MPLKTAGDFQGLPKLKKKKRVQRAEKANAGLWKKTMKLGSYIIKRGASGRSKLIGFGFF